MDDKDFHELIDNTHILSVIEMYGRYQQTIYNRRTMTQTPEVVEDGIELHNKCKIMEIAFERKIAEIVKKYATPTKENSNET